MNDIGTGPGFSAKYQPRTNERAAIVHDMPIAIHGDADIVSREITKCEETGEKLKPSDVKKPEKIYEWMGDEYDINIISGVMGCTENRSVKEMMKGYTHHNVLIAPTK